MKISWWPTNKPCTVEELKAEGIDAESNPNLALKATEGGYIQQDTVSLVPDTDNLDTILEGFWKEHYHDQDEVRFITAGEGIFDVRPMENGPSDDGSGDFYEKWIRIEVSTGDFVKIPAKRYHRFFLSDKRTISATRLFKDSSGWIPHYRHALPPIPEVMEAPQYIVKPEALDLTLREIKADYIKCRDALACAVEWIEDTLSDAEPGGVGGVDIPADTRKWLAGRLEEATLLADKLALEWNQFSIDDKVIVDISGFNDVNSVRFDMNGKKK